MRIHPPSERPGGGASRREFLRGTSALLGGMALLGVRGLAKGSEAPPMVPTCAAGWLARLHPQIEHLRLAYTARAEEIFANLRTLLRKAVDGDAMDHLSSPRGAAMTNSRDTYHHLLSTSRRLLEKALVHGGDNSVLVWLSLYLRRWRAVAPARDPHVISVIKAWQDLQTIHWLNPREFEARRPTLLFVHGSGIGPFPVYNGLFSAFGEKQNVAFFLYDHLEPTDQISRRLNECWVRFRAEHGLTRPVFIVNVSYGSTIFRYGVLCDQLEQWQHSALLEIAPVVLGTRYAKWFAAFPMQKRCLQMIVPSLRHWADGVDGKAGPQRFIWAPENIVRFDRVISPRLSLIPEHDENLTSHARRALPGLLGQDGFILIKGLKHDPAPGHPEVIARARRFFEQWAARPGGWQVRRRGLAA